LSPQPDVGQMVGKATWDDEHRVDAHLVAVAKEARCQPLGGDRDAAQPIFVEGQARGVTARPLLDLDESDRPAAASDQVDLSAGNPRPPLQDSPSVQPQPPCGDGLGPPAAPLGKLAAQGALVRSRARA